MSKRTRLPSGWKLVLSILAAILYVAYTYSSPQQSTSKSTAVTPTQVLGVKSKITHSPQPTLPGIEGLTASSEVLVNRVIDGDTIEVFVQNTKTKVRLIGINSPETVDPRKPVECFGKEASNRLKTLLTGKTIVMMGDSTQDNVDKYNRLLRYIFLNGTNINLQMIREGYAYEYTYDSPYIFQQDFKTAQEQAEGEKKGLWNPQACTIEAP